MKRHTLFRWGEVGQWAGMLVMVGGIALDFISSPNTGDGVLTAGALIWGVATKIKYYTQRRKHVKPFARPWE